MFGIVLIYGGVHSLDDVTILSFFISNPCSYIFDAEKLDHRVFTYRRSDKLVSQIKKINANFSIN
ncbi:MAG: hypothetical protein DRR19_05995 [Candidatus Parabeggiatoa sp. nov. 1]|nr:MAG: hypothetical protein DRR19_05995 [Gammaproteobacteria bacterium]